MRRGQQTTITKSLLAEVLLSIITNSQLHIDHHFLAIKILLGSNLLTTWRFPNPQLYSVNALETISIWGFILAAVVAVFFLLFFVIAFCKVGFHKYRLNSQNSVILENFKCQHFSVCKFPANENGEERSNRTAESVNSENGIEVTI